ncbi:hypothetical protein KIV56_09500 [Cryobacterium breve]|uniref:Uncharacterized protein n=1 Tax=Cryobacterium breve TaxID=1259258 RepID=A0ABY7N8L5_9MICO|nr:hypothetical protein [Cryobacterium breve]WBM78844.1 hypothetical protein KIV56_09500 [Cryobacterium breve]
MVPSAPPPRMPVMQAPSTASVTDTLVAAVAAVVPLAAAKPKTVTQRPTETSVSTPVTVAVIVVAAVYDTAVWVLESCTWRIPAATAAMVPLMPASAGAPVDAGAAEEAGTAAVLAPAAQPVRSSTPPRASRTPKLVAKRVVGRVRVMRSPMDVKQDVKLRLKRMPAAGSA